ncbi:MAG: LVIVD repeat-containing protein [Candidatus Helarchaeota archaeon]
MVLLITVQIGGTTNAYNAGPDPLGTWEPASSLDAVMDVEVSGNLVYAAIDGFGLQILDISNPAAPTTRGSLPIAGSIKSIAISAANNRTYIGASSTLYIIDISNPDSVSIVNSFVVGSTVYGIAVDFPYIYVAGYSESFKIYDESGLIADGNNPGNPWVKNDYWCYDVVFSGDYVYGACSTKGVVAWDVSDKNNPDLLDNVKLGDNVYSIGLISANKVIAGGRAGYMAIVNTANPNDLAKTGELNTAGGDIEDIKASASIAVCADYTYGITTVFVSGNAPVENTRLPPTVRGYGVTTDGTYIIGAGGFYGLYIWDYATAVAGLIFDIPGFSIVLSILVLIGIVYLFKTKNPLLF